MAKLIIYYHPFHKTNLYYSSNALLTSEERDREGEKKPRYITKQRVIKRVQEFLWDS